MKRSFSSVTFSCENFLSRVVLALSFFQAALVVIVCGSVTVKGRKKGKDIE